MNHVASAALAQIEANANNNDGVTEDNDDDEEDEIESFYAGSEPGMESTALNDADQDSKVRHTYIYCIMFNPRCLQ